MVEFTRINSKVVKCKFLEALNPLVENNMEEQKKWIQVS